MAAGLTAIMHGLECIPRKGSVFHHSTAAAAIVQEVWTVFLEQPTQTTLATRPLT